MERSVVDLLCILPACLFNTATQSYASLCPGEQIICRQPISIYLERLVNLVEADRIKERSPHVRVHLLQVSYRFALFNNIGAKRPLPHLVLLVLVDQHQSSPIEVVVVLKELVLVYV